MKRYPFLFLLFIACIYNYNVCFAQTNSKIDSLIQSINHQKTDSLKVDVFIKLHREYIRIDTIKAIEYINKAISLSKETNKQNLICDSYLALCNYYWKRGSLDKAQQILTETKKLLPTVDNKIIDAKYFMESGIVHHQLGNYASSIENYLSAKNLYEIIGDTLAISKCYTNIGNIHWQLENLDNALDNYLIAFKKLDTTNSEHLKSYSNLLGNIGLIHRKKNKYDEALNYYSKSLQINKRLNMRLDEAINLQNMGALYTRMDQHKKSLSFFKESNKISTEINDQIGVLYTNHSIGNAYRNLGNFKESISILNKSLEIAQKLKVNEEIKNITLDLSEAYERQGDFENSLRYRKLFENWKDSLINENHLNKIGELELKYETAQKDKKIDLLHKENELQQATVARQETLKNGLILGLVFLAVIAGLVFYTLRQRLKSQKLIASKNEEIKTFYVKEQMQTLEMKALRAQMNPHFLFNSLNSINTMILSDENDNASKYLSKFSKLVRLMLENSEQPKVSLKDEINMLEAYIQLETLRFSNKIDYKININEYINEEATFLPSMVLQPFVENAIWHGLLHKEERGLLIIDIKEEDEHLHCSIIDNGIGRQRSLKFKREDGLKKKSMGIKITSDRLKLLTKQKINDVIHIIDLKDDKNNSLGTQVDIQIPIS